MAMWIPNVEVPTLRGVHATELKVEAMQTQEMWGFGEARKESLTDLIATIRETNSQVLGKDHHDHYPLAFKVRDNLNSLKMVVRHIVSRSTYMKLESIQIDVNNFESVSDVQARIHAIVPEFEDALQRIDDGYLIESESLIGFLNDRDLAEFNDEIRRIVRNVVTDSPVAVTAARADLESFLKAYVEEEGLQVPSQPTMKSLLKVVMDHLKLDPAEKADIDVKKALQGLRSVVDGIASLRSHAGSAHGRGRHPYRLQARHARLAAEASLTLIKFIVETWNYHDKKRTSH